MNSQQDHEATPNKKIYRGSWLLEHRGQLKWAGLAVLLLLIACALPPLLSAYNATGQCLSRLSKLSESEMKLRVVKSFVAHSIEGETVPEGIQSNRKIMFLGRSITQQELIERSQSETLLDLLKEQPVLLSDEDQLDQFAVKIDAGEFTIIDYSPQIYALGVLPGKSLHRADSIISTEFSKRYRDLVRGEEQFNSIGNYLYENDIYELNTVCCDAKKQMIKHENFNVIKHNLEAINFRKINLHYFVVSNCGYIWIDPDRRYSF
jgi:hypothetical protein